jgi:hypothetical protein
MLYPAELRAHWLQLTHCTALVAFFATGNCAPHLIGTQFCADPAEKSRPELRPRTGGHSATKLLSRRAQRLCQLGVAHSGGVERHQHNAMVGSERSNAVQADQDLLDDVDGSLFKFFNNAEGNRQFS